MAGSVNRAILIGNVGKEPEIARLPNGKPVAKFSLATSETWKDQSGDRQERTTWHNIVVFNEGLTKIIEQYVHKGSKIYVEGSIQKRSYEKDGQTRYVSEITLQGFNGSLTMLDSRNEGSSQGQSNQYEDQSTGAKSYGGAGDIDDSIPFAAEMRA